MAQRPDRRQSARLSVSSQCTAHGGQPQAVRLLDLSLHAARIAHHAPLGEGRLRFVDLPPALGYRSLSGRIVWTLLQREEPLLSGAWPHAYRSGLTWEGLAPAQLHALATTLTILQAHEHALDRACRRDAPREAAWASDAITTGRK